MSKLEELIQELCPNGVEYRILNTFCEVYDGTHQTPNYKDKGIKFVSVENISDLYGTNKYISEEDYAKYKIKPQQDDVLMTRIGSIGICAVVESNEKLAYYVSLALLRPNQNVVDSRYLKYVIESLHGRKELRKRTLVNAVPIKINMCDIGKIKLPVPPLEVQREIVHILDQFTFLTAELTAELTARKKQHEFYRNRLLDVHTWKKDELVNITTLGQCCDVLTGFPFDSSQFSDSGIRLMRGMNVKRGCLDFTEGNNRYWNSPKGVEKYLLNAGDIIIAMDGSLVGKSYGVVQEEDLPLLLVQRVARIRSDKVNMRFLYHCVAKGLPDYTEKKKTAGAVPHISQKDIRNFPLSLPSLESQKKIAYILDNFETICNDLNIGLPAEIQARKKQYEYYRDKLLTF